MIPLVLALLLVFSGAPGATAAPGGECRRSCRPAKNKCLGAARALKQQLRGECAPSGSTRRPCPKAAGEIANGARRSCGPFARACRTCCAASGVDCTARCGDGEVNADVGETCDPPASTCGGGGACSADCRCPLVSTTTSTSTSTTTSTQPGSGPLGPARFVVDGRTQWFASSFAGFNLLEGSASGALVLDATGDAGGDATLALGVDGTIGIKFQNSNYLCMRLSAAGSSGTLHCGGSTDGVNVRWTIDSNGFGPSLRSVLATERGGPSEPGDGFVVAAMRVVSCPADGPGDVPGCLAPLTTTADCLDPAKVSFDPVTPFAAALTTGNVAAIINNPRPGSTGDAVETDGHGTPFPCADWHDEGGEVVLAFPLLAIDLPGIGDWTSVGVIHLVRTDH